MSKKSRRFQNRTQHDAPDMGSARRDFDLDEAFLESGTPARSDRAAKRARFAGASSKSAPSKINPIYVIVPAALILIVGAVLVFQSQPAANASAGTPAANAVREVAIEHTVAGGKIGIPLDEVRKNKLVKFDYESGSKAVPLTAWVAPSGQIKTAVRMCEPCNGTSFRIEGNTLVCNTCGTRWDLETLKGISGGCQKYPPEEIANAIDGDTVVFDEAPVVAWKPRP